MGKMPFVILLALLTSGCGLMTGSGDAGCLTYEVARPSMPRPLPDTPLGSWVANVDVSLTGACT
jgi:hypothetical protein